MLRYFVFFLLICFYLQSSAQKSYSIKGFIKNEINPQMSISGPLKNGNYVYLEYLSGKVDSSIIKDNRFFFEGSIANPEPASLNHAHGGATILLSYESNFEVEFILNSPESGLYEYLSNVNSDSFFYNTWLKVGNRSHSLVKKRSELQNLNQQSINIESKNEIEVINKLLDNLYSSIIKNNQLINIEKAYILMSDPNFSNEKYKSFFDELSTTEKETKIGSLFKKKLENFS
ncbi:DUF4369 domain-containing protein [Sphingobacterium sp. HJSM2_6]|uniref:DUF4369 domain-containing protein n=1 Tax=Sphingobacterium sp. HJSM2_6 TaxID=3366264 RepID=UPI003BDE984A